MPDPVAEVNDEAEEKPDDEANPGVERKAHHEEEEEHEDAEKGNARYWYRRCGRKLREELSTDEELREIRTALSAGSRAKG